jgi:DnaJ-class molecular chaperone
MENKPCDKCNGTGHIVIVTSRWRQPLLETAYMIKVIHCEACNGFGYLAEPKGESQQYTTGTPNPMYVRRESVTGG